MVWRYNYAGTEIITEPLSPSDIQTIMTETPTIGEEIFGTGVKVDVKDGVTYTTDAADGMLK